MCLSALTSSPLHTTLPNCYMRTFPTSPQLVAMFFGEFLAHTYTYVYNNKFFVVRLGHLLGYSEHEVTCELVKLHRAMSLSVLVNVL